MPEREAPRVFVLGVQFPEPLELFLQVREV